MRKVFWFSAMVVAILMIIANYLMWVDMVNIPDGALLWQDGRAFGYFQIILLIGIIDALIAFAGWMVHDCCLD